VVLLSPILVVATLLPGSAYLAPAPVKGRLALMAADGTALRAYGGFADVSHVAPSGPGRLVVVDAGTRALVEIDGEGKTLWSWRSPAGGPSPERAWPLGEDRFLVTAGRDGALEVARDGRIVWSAGSPVTGREVTGAVRLADGSTLVLVKDAIPPLYRISPRGEPPRPLLLPLEPGSKRLPRGLSPGPGAGEALLWDPSWQEVYRVRLEGDEAYVLGRTRWSLFEPNRIPSFIAPAPAGGLVYVSEGLRLGGGAPPGPVARFGLSYEPRAVAPAPAGGGFAVAYAWRKDAVWPDDRPRPGSLPPFDWPRFLLWSGVAVLLALAVGAALRVRPDPRKRARIVALVAAATAAGSALLVSLRSRPGTYADSLGLFLLLLVLLASLGLERRSEAAKKPGRWDVLLPLAVGAATIGWRIGEWPLKTHFDYIYFALSALDVLQGNCPDIWANGYMKFPVAGSLPLALGWLLGGDGALGIRLGGFLPALAGIWAVWFLGREWRGRRTGLLAGLLLAGGSPWLHFGRLNTSIEAATGVAVTLALFVWARSGDRPGRWVAAGMAGGFALYQWPGARAGLVACVLLLIGEAILRRRRTLREWTGPALMALTIWIWLAPLVPLFRSDEATLFPRVENSITVWKPSEGFHADRFVQSLGRPLADAAGWFFITEDNGAYENGALSPGCNPFEALLLAAGIFLALRRRSAVEVLLLLTIALVVLVGGAFINYLCYSRIMPSYPPAVVLMAGAADAGLDALERRFSLKRRALSAAFALLVLFLSPAVNLYRYARLQEGLIEANEIFEMTAVGLELRGLGPGFDRYLVVTEHHDWSLSPGHRTESVAVLLPLVWDLRISELRDLSPALPLRRLPAVLVVQPERPGDVDLIRRFHPDAEVREARGYRPGAAPKIVVVRG